MTGAAPGWYHAEGDPPNTERFWDGTQWTEGPRPIGGIPAPLAQSDPSDTAGPAGSEPAPTSMPTIDTGSSPVVGGPPPVAGAPGMGGPGVGSPGLPTPSMGSAPPAGGFFAEKSQATTALVLSIVGFFCCGFPAIGGVFLARQEQKGIEGGRRDTSKQGMATAALVVGIIVLVMWALAYSAWILAVIVSSN